MEKNVEINLDRNGISINGVFAQEMTKDFLIAALGEPRIIDRDGKKALTFMWDDIGVKTYTNNDRESISSLYLECPSLSGENHWDTPKSDFAGSFTVEKKPFIEKIPKKKLEDAYIYLENIKIGNWKIEACFSEELQNKLKELDIKRRVANPSEVADLVRNASNPFGTISVRFEPKRVSSEKYKHKMPGNKILSFDNFNFKLAVVQELMYNKKLIEPKFDVYDFAKDYVKREIDVEDEGYKPIREVKKWFEELPINASLAENIEELYLDGGNDIYLQIIPLWDGEDSYYEIKAISREELSQFSKLERVTTAMGIGKNAKAVLGEAGIEVEEL